MNHILRDIPYRTVGTHQTKIEIRQNGGFGQLIEKERTSTDKGLMVSAIMVWHSGSQLVEKLSLPAGPLEEWLCFVKS